MKIKQAAIAFVLTSLMSSAAHAASRTYTIPAGGKNLASFRIEDSMETIAGTTAKISGSIVADPENVAASSTEVSVDLSSLDTGNALRNQQVRERFLETTKFPAATFKSVSVRGPASPVEPNKPVDVELTGDFTMHGLTKRIVVPVRIVLIPESDLTRSTRGPGNWIHATAIFSVRLPDFDVHVPDTFLVNTVDPIPVKIDVFANAR